MKRPLSAIALLGVLLPALLFAPWLQADDEDHERARQALEAGEVLPLRTILDRLEQDYPGDILEVELEREEGRWVYEIKLLRDNGAVNKLEFDARNGTLLRIRGRDIAPQEQGGR